jgi:hypothetical protein
MEMIRLATFSAITQAGITSVDRKTNDVSARPLVDDYRKLAMSQLVLERKLLMTPASRAQLSPGEQPTDLVAMMASASGVFLTKTAKGQFLS